MPSGIFGQVINGAAAVSNVMNWDLTDTKSSDSYVASNTLQGTVRGGGIRTWSGSFMGKGTTPPVMPGDTFDFIGYTTPGDGNEGGIGMNYSGLAIVNQVTINWNWATNTILEWSCQFNGTPGLDYVDAAPVLDVSIPTVGATCGTKVEYADGPAYDTFIEIPAITAATLTMTSELATEANSSTIADGECWQNFSKGPIDWNLALPQEDYLRGVDGYPELGVVTALRISVNATQSYLLKFAITQDYSNLVVDRNGGNTIARTLNFAMGATDGTGMGQILLPGETEADPWWGLPVTP